MEIALHSILESLKIIVQFLNSEQTKLGQNMVRGSPLCCFIPHNSDQIDKKFFNFQGLTLDLFIEQDEYIKQLSEEAGVKVVIVDSNKHPFPFQEGVAVSPGAATAIALRKVRVCKTRVILNVISESLLSSVRLFLHFPSLAGGD